MSCYEPREEDVHCYCNYLRKLLGAITQLVVRDWNAWRRAADEGPTTNSYKLIHLSRSRLATDRDTFGILYYPNSTQPPRDRVMKISKCWWSVKG